VRGDADRRVGLAQAGVAAGVSASAASMGLLFPSACAASVVTLLSATLLVRLNVRDLPAPVRLRGWRLIGMILAIAFYAFVAVGTVVTQLQRLG
jgi:hypothetical protein